MTQPNFKDLAKEHAAITDKIKKAVAEVVQRGDRVLLKYGKFRGRKAVIANTTWDFDSSMTDIEISVTVNIPRLDGKGDLVYTGSRAYMPYDSDIEKLE